MLEVLRKVRLYGLNTAARYATAEIRRIIGSEVLRGSYSQRGEDVLIERLLGDQPDGFYVDIGANDPNRFSNTKRFYKKGWHGINVEPHPKAFARFAGPRARDINLNVGIGLEEGLMRFHQFFPETMSTFSDAEAARYVAEGFVSEGTVNVPVHTLASILNEHAAGKEIDFLSVDTEGLDLTVLQSNDWERFRPKFVCIEAAAWGQASDAEQRTDLREFLASVGYEMALDNGLNQIFHDARRTSRLSGVPGVPALPFARVAVATHCTPLTGVLDPLEVFLSERVTDVYVARHPFSYTGDRDSKLWHWHKGDIVERTTMGSPPSISLLKDVLANFIWFSRLPKQDVFIGIDNVNAFCGILLRWFGKTDKVVYYVIDWTPRRFKNRVLNAVYHAVDRFAVSFCDEIWNISPRIRDVRDRLQHATPTKNRVIPYGMEFSLIRWPQERNRHDLVIMAHLTREKGIQLAIQAMPIIIERVPDSRLLIVGDGPYAKDLRDLAASLHLGDAVQFLGVVPRDDLYTVLPKCGIGLAPYMDEPGSITYYADPGKPKEYLSCGLPVIITDVPFIAEDIERLPMGMKIQYEQDALIEAAVKLMTDEAFYDLCVENAKAYTADLDWTKIFETAFDSRALAPAPA